jgi:hypothetical protein
MNCCTTNRMDKGKQNGPQNAERANFDPDVGTDVPPTIMNSVFLVLMYYSVTSVARII